MEDNWYERQRAEERKTSAWDLDGMRDSASVVRNEHEDHCDSRELATYHRVEEHVPGRGTGEVVPATALNGTFWVGLDFVNVFIAFFLTFMEILPVRFTLIFFLLVNPGIFILIGLYKGNANRASQSVYWKLVFIFEIFVYVIYLGRLFIVRR